MIESELELQQSIEQLERMYRMLLEFRRRIAPLNYKNYEVFAEGPREEIRRLQREIDEYLSPQSCSAGSPTR
jgi:hypothetical protein